MKEISKTYLMKNTTQPDVKIALIKSISANTPPPTPSSFSVRTSNAAAASGTELLEVKPLTSGLNKVIETVGEVANNAVTKIPEAITESSENIKESTEKYQRLY